MQTHQIIYPPVTALFGFLSYILSTVPMVIETYSESKMVLWGWKGGEWWFSVWLGPAVASSSLFAFCLGFDKLNCLSSILFSGSSAEMHLSEELLVFKASRSTLIWDPQLVCIPYSVQLGV